MGFNLNLLKIVATPFITLSCSISIVLEINCFYRIVYIFLSGGFLFHHAHVSHPMNHAYTNGQGWLVPMFLVLTKSIDIWYDNTLLYFVLQHGKIFSMIVIVEKLVYSGFWWCIGKNMALTIWDLKKRMNPWLRRKYS